MPLYLCDGTMHALNQEGRIILSKNIDEKVNGGMTGFLRQAASLEGCTFPEREVKIARTGWRGLLVSMVSLDVFLLSALAKHSRMPSHIVYYDHTLENLELIRFALAETQKPCQRS